ncbi:UBX domain protein 11 [Pycnococcus provasolii]|uniref:UBX domain protein 11 n=1 Tax=Pycnococcus provasolii TaxID=41880 RepID=A0A830HI64_9CHLO|nr:UBX domain protein 11 [Pycnococcus provasolii]
MAPPSSSSAASAAAASRHGHERELGHLAGAPNSNPRRPFAQGYYSTSGGNSSLAGNPLSNNQLNKQVDREAVARLLKHHNNRDMGAPQGSKGSAAAAAAAAGNAGNADVVATMAKRLAAVEREMREYRVAKEAAETKANALDRQCASLRGKNKQLETQCADWERRARAAEGAAKAATAAAAASGTDSTRDDEPEDDHEYDDTCSDDEPEDDEQGASEARRRVKHLTNECKRLRRLNQRAWAQVFELKQFLRDYGMVWVGGDENDDEEEDGDEGDHQAAQKQENSLPPFKFDFAALIRKADDLSHATGIGEADIKAKDGKARVVAPHPIELEVYEDGVRLSGVKASPNFLPFTEKESRAVVEDILDGYYPYVIKDEYPNGAAIKIIDRTWRRGADASSFHAFQGAGNRVGRKSAANIHDLHTVAEEEAGERPLSRGRFLAQLPKAVVRNGKVVDVRGAVNDVLRGVSPSNDGADAGVQADTALLHEFVMRDGAMASNPAAAMPQMKPGATMRTKAANAADRRLAAGSFEEDDGVGDDSLEARERGEAASSSTPSIFDTAAAKGGALPDARAWTLRRAHAEDWACIKVRLGDGGTLDVRLPFAATLSMAYEEVRRARGKRGAKFELRAAMPPRAFGDDETTTLEEAGLTPSAALFVRDI